LADDNLEVLDRNGTTKYIKATGAGSDADPYVLHRRENFPALTHVEIDSESASSVEVIAAPGADTRIRIVSFVVSSAVNVEFELKSGATTIGTYYGASIVLDPQIPINLGTNEAFNLDATTADRIMGSVSYYTESV